MTPNRLIGKFEGGLPWHISEDLKLFKRVTMGHPVVMGRKTYETRNKALPGRQNIVLTRDPGWWVDDAIVINRPEQLAGVVQMYDKVFIIGGADIYSIFLPYIGELHVSTVFLNVEEKEEDVYFPEFMDEFDFYQIMETHPEFEYGIYRKDDKKRQPVPFWTPPIKKTERERKNIPVKKKVSVEPEKQKHTIKVT